MTVAFGFLSGAAEGAHGAGTFLGLPLAVWQATNLVLFFVLLVYLLRKPAASFFTGRRDRVENALKKAEEERRRAEELAAQLDARLTRLQTDLAEVKEHARREALAEQEALKKQAEEDAARIVARAAAEMDSRVKSARQELAGYAGDLAVGIARDILEKSVTDADEKRLADEGLAEIVARAKG